jgi:hypothetical protein
MDSFETGFQNNIQEFPLQKLKHHKDFGFQRMF